MCSRQLVEMDRSSFPALAALPYQIVTGEGSLVGSTAPYVAYAPAFGKCGLRAYGSSVEEALADLEEMTGSFISSWIDQYGCLPPPDKGAKQTTGSRKAEARSSDRASAIIRPRNGSSTVQQGSLRGLYIQRHAEKLDGELLQRVGRVDLCWYA